jgi:hypothetical protein
VVAGGKKMMGGYQEDDDSSDDNSNQPDHQPHRGGTTTTTATTTAAATMSAGFAALSSEEQALRLKAQVAHLIELSDQEAQRTGKEKTLSYRNFRQHCSERLGFNFSQSGDWKAKIKEVVQTVVGVHDQHNRDGSLFEQTRQYLGPIDTTGGGNGGGSGGGGGSGSGSNGGPLDGWGPSGNWPGAPPLLGFQQIRSPSIFGTGALHPPQLRSPTHAPPHLRHTFASTSTTNTTPGKGVHSLNPTDLTPVNGLMGVPPPHRHGWDEHATHKEYFNMPHPGPSSSGAKVPSPPRRVADSDEELHRRQLQPYHQHTVSTPHTSAAAAATAAAATSPGAMRPQSGHVAPPPPSRPRQGHRSTPARASDDPMRHHTSKSLVFGQSVGIGGRTATPYSRTAHSGLTAPGLLASGPSIHSQRMAVAGTPGPGAPGPMYAPEAQPYSHLAQAPGAHVTLDPSSSGGGQNGGYFLSAGGPAPPPPLYNQQQQQHPHNHHHLLPHGQPYSSPAPIQQQQQQYVQYHPRDNPSYLETQDMLPTTPQLEPARERSRSPSSRARSPDGPPRQPMQYNTQEYGRHRVQLDNHHLHQHSQQYSGGAPLPPNTTATPAPPVPMVGRHSSHPANDHLVRTPMADPSVWRWKGAGSNGGGGGNSNGRHSPPTTRHSALLINKQRLDQAGAADQIGSYSKPRHERSPPPPKSPRHGVDSSNTDSP